MKTIKTAKTITIGLFTLCTIALSNATFAGSTTENPTELKYLGKVNEHPVFQLNLNNNEDGAYFINIVDENQNVLYSEKVQGSNLSRRYQLAIDRADLEAPGFGVTFRVTSAKTHKTQVYKVSTQTKVTENIVVAEL